MKKLPEGLDFKDASLIPDCISYIISRSHIKTVTKIGSMEFNIPIIAAPMKDVCDGNISRKMRDYGATGILHRFCSIDEQVKNYQSGYAAIGVNEDYVDRFHALYSAGCRQYCLDCANGGHILVRNAISKLLSIYSDIEFIIGNIASAKVFKMLQEWPKVVGIRVGIAGGAACTTKLATAIISPMLSLIQECKIIQKNVAIISDGSIKEPADFCKAIAAGADAVMVGSIISQTKDSPAELIIQDGRYYKLYHGSASFHIQKIYKENPKYIEGQKKLLPYNDENLNILLERYMDGLVSSMSYFNADTIAKYQQNANWCILR